MYGEYFYSEAPYSGEAVTEAALPEFEDDWVDVDECVNEENWTDVECQ